MLHCRISGPKDARRASLPNEASEPQPKSTRRASLPDEAPEPQQNITAAAGRRQSAGRRKSEPALLHNAKAGALAGKAFLVTGFEDDNLRRHMHKFICKNGGSVIDSIPPPEVPILLSANGMHGHCAHMKLHVAHS